MDWGNIPDRKKVHVQLTGGDSGIDMFREPKEAQQNYTVKIMKGK